MMNRKLKAKEEKTQCDKVNTAFVPLSPPEIPNQQFSTLKKPIHSNFIYKCENF